MAASDILCWILAMLGATQRSRYYLLLRIGVSMEQEPGCRLLGPAIDEPKGVLRAVLCRDVIFYPMDPDVEAGELLLLIFVKIEQLLLLMFEIGKLFSIALIGHTVLISKVPKVNNF